MIEVQHVGMQKLLRCCCAKNITKLMCWQEQRKCASSNASLKTNPKPRYTWWLSGFPKAQVFVASNESASLYVCHLSDSFPLGFAGLGLDRTMTIVEFSDSCWTNEPAWLPGPSIPCNSPPLENKNGKANERKLNDKLNAQNFYLHV